MSRTSRATASQEDGASSCSDGGARIRRYPFLRYARDRRRVRARVLRKLESLAAPALQPLAHRAVRRLALCGS